MKLNYYPGFQYDVQAELATWAQQNNTLYRKFEFKNFTEAFAFMTKVAAEAEKMNHHPLWSNVWNKVEIWLNTHDEGDIVTEKDRQLAKQIDALFEKLSPFTK